jgi:WASH complex subunit strumpellin
LTRIAQAAQGDEVLSLAMESVSDYFSTQLVAFVRKVLHVIPVTIFEKLKDIVKIQVEKLKECPTKIPKDQLKDFAQLDVRARYAMLTCEIAKFADGILAMERTLVGVISVDPQRLLEEGVRRELVEKVSIELNQALRFDEKKPILVEEVDARLGLLANLLGGMKTSLEYIQDYIGIYGLKMWQEEYSRIINFNVEMECNQFMLQYISHWQSAYQSDVIPIPYFEPRDDTYGFLGRLMKILLTMTDPRRCIYLHHLGAWYDPQKVWKELVGPRLFTRIHTSIATQGLNGLDRLLCFLIAKELKQINTRMRQTVATLTSGNNNRLLALQNLLAPFSGIPKDSNRYYTEWSAFRFEFLDILGLIGRAQLIRKHIANELRFCAKLHSNAMHKALSTVNQSILCDVQSHYLHPEENPYPASAISALTPYMDSCGMGHPVSKIYITSEQIPELGIIMFLQFLRVLPRFIYEDRMDCLIPKKREDAIDACGVAVGILTVLQQFHRSMRDQFFDLVCQYIRCSLNDYENAERKTKEKDIIPQDVLIALHFVDLMSQVLGVSMEDLAKHVPSHILIRFKSIPMVRR